MFLAFLWTQVFAAYSNSEMKTLVKNSGSGYIRLSEANYKKHLYGHRDYDVVLFMTSQAPQLNCVLCREYTPAFEAVAQLYSHTFPEGVSTGRDLYFLYADFLDAKSLFLAMGLDLIPKLYYMAATPESTSDEDFNKQNNPYPFYQGDFVELTNQWVYTMTGHRIEVYTPPDYSKMVFNAIATFAVVFVFKRFRTQIFAILKSNYVWGIGTIILVLLFISGQMFTQIRSVPFMYEKKEGVEVFATNAQMQYGVETQIVSTMYGLMGIVFLVLANRVSSIKNSKVQFMAVTIVSVLLYLLYSIFLSIFNIKYRGYPYMLLDLGVA